MPACRSQSLHVLTSRYLVVHTMRIWMGVKKKKTSPDTALGARFMQSPSITLDAVEQKHIISSMRFYLTNVIKGIKLLFQTHPNQNHHNFLLHFRFHEPSFSRVHLVPPWLRFLHTCTQKYLVNRLLNHISQAKVPF
jgi:hypothetical protein